MSLLSKRYYCDNYDVNSDGTTDCNDGWYTWGRWVLLGGLVIGALILFFLFSCFSARRRRRAGRNPYYGTGWLAHGHGPVQYYGPNSQNQQQGYYGQQQYAQQPPQYSQNYNNQDYYGGQQSGIELQRPQNAYQSQAGGESVYMPPQGPPPRKG